LPERELARSWRARASRQPSACSAPPATKHQRPMSRQC
jgi:hypothetical protein